jgi:glycosidase
MKSLSASLAIGLVAAVSFAGFARQCVAQPVPSPAPAIQKIDPPDWFAGLPDPMLLLRGENLAGAKFVVAGESVTILSSKVSDNGHWAFLWLATGNAQPQQLTIRATSARGTAAATFILRARKPVNAGFQGFSPDDVMYLIMTDRFADGDPSNNQPARAPGGYDRSLPKGWHGGDLRGIEQHLDYLQSLGVTTVWTTPVYDNTGSPDSYHGYGATDMYGVDPHFGTLADYQHLAGALHQRGMKLVLDTVPNHVGAGHPWAADPPMPDWFHGTVAKHAAPNYDFHSIPDPHSAPLESRDVTAGWFANVLPDMNQENPVVAKYLIQNAVWWVETAGLDGLRLDTFPYIRRDFWHDFHAELHALYPHLTTVGEVFNGDATITSYFAGGVVRRGVDTGLDTPFDFPTYFTLRNVLAGDQPVTALPDVLRQDWLYPHPERLVTFLGNHDTRRFLSEKGANSSRLELAFGLLATMRGMPQIYSGDEIAMQGGDDPDNRHDFPGGFPGDAASAFTAQGRTADQAQMFDWVSGVLRVRSQHPALRAGEQQNVFSDATALAFVRAASVATGCNADQQDRLLVVMNKADSARELRLETRDTALAGCTSLADAFNAKNPARMEGSTFVLTLDPQQLAIYAAK